MNKILIEHLKKYEGCKLEAYLCPAGVWTVGYGCTGKDITKGTKWTAEKANTELEKRASECIAIALKLSPILAGEGKSSKCAAIASFIFNCGADAYRKSTLKQSVDMEHWHEAAVQIKRWVHGGGKRLPGLVTRRDAEALMLTKEA